jgi:capsular exopolysaccharide synthesis family protein
MTLERSWVILIKQWKLIVACMVLIGLGTYLASRLITPTYQSSTLVRVVIQSTNSFSDYNNLLASDQLVQTESQLATSGPVLREVASHYPGLTTERLTRATTTTPRLNTQLFEINVSDTNPVRAAKIANDIAEILINQQIQENQQDRSRSQEQIQKELDTTHTNIDNASKKMQIQQQQIAQGKGSQSQIAGLQTSINGLQDQLNRLQDHYSHWQTMLLQLEMAQAQNNNFLRIVQPAQPAKNPVKPQILLNTVAGLAAGLSLGLLLAVLIEQLDTRVRTMEDITRLLNCPALGVVWRVDSAKDKHEKVINPKINSANAEAYHMLRTNIGFSAVDKPLRSLVITSAMPGDGKSSIAANLAIFMARAGKNTLLIDADLRHPTQHAKFLIPTETKGLSEAIMACSQHQSIASKSSTPSDLPYLSLEAYMYAVDIPNLLVMPSGLLPPNPSELLDSKAMDNLLTTLINSGIEMVIVDAPSLLGMADASILTAIVDGTIVVADITRVKKKNLQYLKAQLVQSGTRILGFVVNKQHYNRRDMPYAYYYNLNADKDDDQKEELSQKQQSIGVPASSPLFVPEEQRN